MALKPSKNYEREIAKRFGGNLRKLLIDRDMRQKELAERSGITPTALSLLLSGRREPMLSTILKLQNVIPFKVEEMLK